MAGAEAGYTFGLTATVWMDWYNTTSTASTSSNLIWADWLNCGTTGAGTTGLRSFVDTNALYLQPSASARPRALTAEELEANRVRAEEAMRRSEKAKLAKRRAQVRAKRLLREILDPDQRRELAASGYFHVETKDGARVYRFAPGKPPIRIKGEDGRRWAYCIHPSGIGYPAEDTVVALKLLLEADEEAFLRTANASAVVALNVR